MEVDTEQSDNFQRVMYESDYTHISDYSITHILNQYKERVGYGKRSRKKDTKTDRH